MIYEDPDSVIVSWDGAAGGTFALSRSDEPTSDWITVADGLSEDNLTKSLANMRGLISKTVDAMPTHQQFIDRFCGIKPTMPEEVA